MPYINVKILVGHSHQRKQQIAKAITENVSRITQIPEDNIWVVIEDVEKENWAVGGTLLSDK